MEAAAVRPSVQVGGPSSGQRASDPGPPSQQSQPPPPPTLAYQQRITSGASPIHRPVDTPQPYSKGGIGPPPSQQPSSRSATSPLSPPRPGGAVNHAAYSRFADVSATSLRYVQGNQYGVGQMQQFRDSPYARISQVPAPMQEYHRAGGQPIATGNSSMSMVSAGSAGTMETGPQGHSSGRQRIALIATPQHANEYMSNSRPPPQAPPDPGGQSFKKIRVGETNHPPAQQLKVDTREHRPATTEAYHPQVEAISPTLPNDTVEERRPTKDDLLNQINKVDKEITKAENAKTILKNKEKALEEASAKPAKEPEPSEAPPKHRSLAQKIYAENRKRAQEEHAVLAPFSPQNELPLYNQPSDVEILQEIIQRHDQSIKSRLMLHLRRVKSERAARNTAFVEKYAQLSQEWQKRVEKIESSAKRKAKDAKSREFFEKVFTELRKQREDKERFNRVGSRIKSEADLEEIMDGLQEQAMEDKKMRSYAVIPPPMYDSRQRRCVYSNENGYLEDMVADYKESENLNMWTTGEKEIFKEKFLQHPKNFGAIAASLDRKSAQDCVRYYYLSKKTENYKQLLRKSRQRTRSSRNPQKAQQAQAQCIVDSLTTGVTTRLQREQQQKTGGRDRAAQSTAVGTAVGAGGTSVSISSVPTSASSSGVAATLTGSSGVTAGTSAASSMSSAPSPTSTGLTVNSGNTSLTTLVSACATVTTSSSSSGAISNSKNMGSAGIGAFGTSGGAEATAGQSANGAVASGSLDTSKELAPTVNSTENAATLEQQPLSSEGAFIASNSDGANLSVSSTSTASGNSTANCNTALNSAGAEVVTEVSSTAAATGNANSLPTPTPTMPTFNGLKTELVITNAVVNLNDGKSLCNDKERKSPAVATLSSDEKSNLNSLGVRPRPSSADSCEASEPKKTRLDSDSSSNQTSMLVNNEKTPDMSTVDSSKDKFHPCFVCKTESCPRTRPLKKGRGQQYGIPDDTIPTGARVCNSCQCKSVRNRYPNCPLPTCPNSKDRAKRLHNIPSRLYELAPEIRDPILLEFQIPPNATRCCSACLMRIRRKLDPHSTLTDDERRTMLTDGDESDLSTSSCDERDAASSDTASAESPNNPLRQSISQKDENQVSDPTIVPLSRKTSSFEDDRLLPPLGQAPRKQKTTEEYDSSATETADEENENSPANRQSPKCILHPNTATMSMVAPSSLQNGPQREQPSEQQTNVQEIMYHFIERSVKTLKPSTLSIAKQPSSNDTRDVAFVREYRNDIVAKPITTSVSTPVSMQSVQQVPQQISQSRQLQQQPQSSVGGPTESLATLSVVNSQSHIPQQIISHQHGITATITPVKSSIQQQPQTLPPPSQLQPPSGVIAHEMSKEDIIYGSRNEPEPQTLDLSIKKTSTRDSISVHTPVSHGKVQQQPLHSSIAMYRNDQPNSQPQHQSQNSVYLTYHPQIDLNRPTKSPSIYVSQVPASLSQQGVRTQTVPPSQSAMGIQHQHQQQQQMQVKQKVAPKLSPKIHQQSPSPSQMLGSGPKGSITHGTPVNSQQQQMLIQSAAALSPRYEGLPRQTPPGATDGNKIGSITQGTPVHHIQDKQRTFYEFKSNRQSPAQQGPPPPSAQPQMPPQPPQQSSPQTQSFMSSPYVRPSFVSYETRQIVMHDYITSQQMQGPHCRQGRSEKESQSPRASMAYYTDKDRARPEYLSRTSPAEHINSTPSPHRTPPPQRQGVIQRHNTGGSKPPSPSPNRHPIMSHYPAAGHEAFSSFVEVAVQQPSLPVPQKEDKRAVLMPVGDHQGPSPHYDIRYQMTPEQQMQIHHHQQQQQQQQQQHLRQQQAAADMQRRIHAQQERDHRERQERENVERQNQERLQAERDRIDRERERERERERIRMAEEQEREERRRETARAMPSGGMAGPYMRNKMLPNVNRGIPEREREAIRRTQNTRQPSEVTPAAIIDAIIQNSIKGTSDPLPRRDMSGRTQQFYATREQSHPSSISISENNGKSSSPNVINIELDGDRGRKQEIGTITIGELTDSIIAKDYGPSAVLSRTPTYMIPPMQEIVTTDQWKYRRIHQKEAEQAAAAAAANAAAAERNKVPGHGRSGTPDERQIIRMAQPQSPRNKFTVMSQGHFYPSVHGASPPVASVSSMDRRMGGAPPSHQFELDCYVKNRIVEAMRTEDERRPDDGHLHGHHGQVDVLRQGGPYGKEMDGRPNSGSSAGGKSTPVNYEDERRNIERNSSGGMSMNASNSDSSHGPLSYPPPQSQQPPPATTFASKTCAYPYNILDVSVPPQVSSKQVDIGVPPAPPQQTIAAEPKPLLQPHYEALSDED